MIHRSLRAYVKINAPTKDSHGHQFRWRSSFLLVIFYIDFKGPGAVLADLACVLDIIIVDNFIPDTLRYTKHDIIQALMWAAPGGVLLAHGPRTHWYQREVPSIFDINLQVPLGMQGRTLCTQMPPCLIFCFENRPRLPTRNNNSAFSRAGAGTIGFVKLGRNTATLGCSCSNETIFPTNPTDNVS